MNLLWFIAAAAVLASLVAWRKARAAEKRVEQLSHMYWELKYQHGELRGQVQRLAPPDQSRRDSAEPEAAAPRPADGFIPLSSLKR